MNHFGMVFSWLGFHVPKNMRFFLKKNKKKKNDSFKAKYVKHGIASETLKSENYNLSGNDVENIDSSYEANDSGADNEFDDSFEESSGNTNKDNKSENRNKVECKDLAVVSSATPQKEIPITCTVEVHMQYDRGPNKHNIKCDKYKSTSGDESDVGEKSEKNKRLLSKKKRNELKMRKRNSVPQLNQSIAFLPRRKRSGYLSSKNYLLHETYQIEKRTKFHEVFFAYKPENLKYLQMIESSNNFPEAWKDKLAVHIMHTFAYPLPFPIMKYEDMSTYKDILRAKRNELKYLETFLRENCPRHFEFFYIKIISLLAFTYLGERHLDKALDCLEQGNLIVQDLEPCEWTGWIHLAFAFYYICSHGIGGPRDCLEKARDYLQHAREHFLVDIEMGASLGIGSSLSLWWIFLIESETLTMSEMASHGKDISIEGNIQLKQMTVQTYGEHQGKHKRCESILETFHGETSQIETFPTELEKTKQIIEKYQRNQDEQMKNKQWIVTLHRQLIKDLNRSSSGVPKCIQSMYKSFKLGKIIMNVDHDKIEEAEAFVKKNSPSIYKLKVLHFIPQEFKPEYVGDDLDLQYTANALKEGEGEEHLFSNGALVLALTDDEVKEVKDKKGNLNISSKEIPGILGYEIKYGTFGDILEDKESHELYGTTCKHCLDRFPEKLEKDFFGTNKVQKNVYIETSLNGIKQIRQLSDQYWGILDSLELANEQQVSGIDKAIFKLDKSFISKVYSNLKPKNVDNNPVDWEMYTEDSVDMIGKEVQKTGAKTSKTVGNIADVDLDFWVGGKMCEGMFIVCLKTSECFADTGDSGSWVMECKEHQSEAKVYGYVHKVQKNYKHKGDNSFIYPHVTFCLRLDNAVKAINQAFTLNLDIHNKEADSGYSTLDQQPSSDTSASNSTKKERKVSKTSMTQKQASEDSEISLDEPGSIGGANGGDESDFSITATTSGPDDDDVCDRMDNLSLLDDGF